jgi:nitronate monooxygenase
MSTHTQVCELLGIEHPIVQAPVAADPRLPAAVSNAGALGSVALWWADDAGDWVRETAALTDRPFAGNFVLTSARRLPGWAPGSCWPTRCRSTRSIGAA